MGSLRQRAVRSTGVLSLIALLLVPLALASHAHADPVAARSCAICVVAHHSPAVASPAPAVAAGVVTALAPSASPPPVTGRAERSPHGGRAPPSSVPAVA